MITHMLKLSNGTRAGSGVLADTHGGVLLIHLTHLSLLAVVVQAGAYEGIGENCSNILEHKKMEHMKVFFSPLN